MAIRREYNFALVLKFYEKQLQIRQQGYIIPEYPIHLHLYIIKQK